MRRIAVVLALLAASPPASLHAVTTVTYTFDGQVDTFSDLSGTAVVPPMPPFDFTLTATLNLNTPGVDGPNPDPFNPTRYTANGPVANLTLSFSHPDLDTLIADSFFVDVRNFDPPDTAEDQFDIRTFAPAPTDTTFPGSNGNGLASIQLFLGTGGGPNTVFTSEDLPTSLELADFSNTDAINFRLAYGVVGTTPEDSPPVIWDYRGELTGVDVSVDVRLLPGDANNDGQVTGADLIAVQQHFGNMDGDIPIGLLLGDADDDGQVAGADLVSVQQHFGNVLMPASGSAPVPEPASLALLAIGAFLLHREADMELKKRSRSREQ